LLSLLLKRFSWVFTGAVLLGPSAKPTGFDFYGHHRSPPVVG